MSELKFGNAASLRARDEAVRGKPIERMYASFGQIRSGICEQCMHFAVTTENARPGYSCRLYERTGKRVKTWPKLAYACGRFEAKAR